MAAATPEATQRTGKSVLSSLCYKAASRLFLQEPKPDGLRHQQGQSTKVPTLHSQPAGPAQGTRLGHPHTWERPGCREPSRGPSRWTLSACALHILQSIHPSLCLSVCLADHVPLVQESRQSWPWLCPVHMLAEGRALLCHGSGVNKYPRVAAVTSQAWDGQIVGPTSCWTTWLNFGDTAGCLEVHLSRAPALLCWGSLRVGPPVFGWSQLTAGATTPPVPFPVPPSHWGWCWRCFSLVPTLGQGHLSSPLVLLASNSPGCPPTSYKGGQLVGKGRSCRAQAQVLFPRSLSRAKRNSLSGQNQCRFCRKAIHRECFTKQPGQHREVFPPHGGEPA
jgi:hypothetical protein